LFCVVLLTTIAAIAPTKADTTLHVIDLRHRPADEILPVVQPLVEPGGSITGVNFQLFVSASARNFADIKRIVTTLDVPERMLHISVRESGSHTSLDESQEISGAQQIGTTRVFISTGSASGPDGVSLGTNTPNSLRYHVEHRTSTQLKDNTQVLNVLDGGRAFIQVGQSLPEVQPYAELANGRFGAGTAIAYRDVATGFDVLPRVHGDRVQLEVTPRFDFGGERGTQPVDFQELSTTIDARLGEWVDLGGAVGTSNEVTRAILRGTAASAHEGMRILIRVDE